MTYEIDCVSDDGRTRQFIAFKNMNTNPREYYWPVNVSPGFYHIEINNLDSNTFIVNQQEKNINNINYRGRSYKCVDTGESNDEYEAPPPDDEYEAPPDDEYEAPPDDEYDTPDDSF
ncbi:20095_t:CDS:1 [Racocetra fulgida]|uniref:20095_t:CDS:1 n=1 Tax=Racocetra fulgida TaxID=60492 RepID=A0A9N8ZM80_9GLOM|nr:20095_t:CDS:1 [Racocetra fulgida]